MDYGAYLKKEHKNPSRRSIHHIKQSRFHGSPRQIRGWLIKSLSHEQLPRLQCFSECKSYLSSLGLPIDTELDGKIDASIMGLITDCLIVEDKGILSIKDS